MNKQDETDFDRTGRPDAWRHSNGRPGRPDRRAVWTAAAIASMSGSTIAVNASMRASTTRANVSTADWIGVPIVQKRPDWNGRAERLDRSGDRVERRLDNRGDRANRRLDNKGDRIDHRLTIAQAR